jgi:hypothetical protein
VGEDIVPLLERWVNQSPDADYSWYREYSRQVLSSSEEPGTGHEDLANILEQCEVPSQPFTETNISPRQLQQRLEQGERLIIGVGINENNGGSLIGSTDHWIVVDAIYPNGTGGTVVYYNPYTNNQEICSFDELITAMGGFGNGYDGLWVQTGTQP